MHHMSLILCMVVLCTTATAAVSYEYHPLYNVTSDVPKCQAGLNDVDAFNDFGCIAECRGVAVDGVCVCVACDTSITKDSDKSLQSTVVTTGEHTVLHSPAFTMDIGTAVFPSTDGHVQVDVYDHDVVFGVLTTQRQVSEVFVFRPLVTPLDSFIGVTINYSANAVYPGWIPFVYTMNVTSGIWYDIGGSLSYGDGTIYFETTNFIGQYVVVALSKSGALLSPRSFYGRVCDCDPNQDLEISMPCSSESDVKCSPPRHYSEIPKKQFTLVVTLPEQDASTIDEYLYRAALAQLSHVDFRDIAVSSVVVE